MGPAHMGIIFPSLWLISPLLAKTGFSNGIQYNKDTDPYRQEVPFMDDLELRELLQRLHDEIEETHTVDDKGRELLQHLDMDIRDLLDRLEDDGREASSPSLIQSLEDSIDHLQTSHPMLSSMISQVLTTLSNAGI
jgi:hypothetical protein